jgi:hydrogenase nickel incorporation protein HypA/HybF
MSMHEYSIARSLVTLVEAQAMARRASAVRAVTVRIGELSGVDAGLLATAYETLSGGTVCERSALEVFAVPARWACRACGRAIGPGGPLRCVTCRGPAVLRQGDEITLARIEMDVDEDGEEGHNVRDRRN